MFRRLVEDKAVASLGKSKYVCGVEISKMPLGAYLKALDKLKTLPEDFIRQCFPDMNLEEILDDLSQIDERKILNIVNSMFITVPEYLVNIVSELTGVEKYILLEDDNIGLNGFIEIVKTFIELNELGKSIRSLQEMKKTTTILIKNPNIGSKN